MAADITILLGPPGAGKSLQAKILAKKNNAVHISTGQIIRENLNSNPKIAQVLARGELVDSKIMEQLLQASLDKIDLRKPILLDGFPRREDEAKWLDQYSELSTRNIRKVILIEITEDESRKRIIARKRDINDTAEVVSKRWQEYFSDIAYVIKHYQDKGIFLKVNGMGTPEEIATKISTNL